MLPRQYALHLLHTILLNNHKLQESYKRLQRVPAPDCFKFVELI